MCRSSRRRDTLIGAMRCKLVFLALLLGAYGCGDDSSPAPTCWGSSCGTAGTSGSAGSPATDGSSGSTCTPLADVTDLIGSNEVFFGYSVLGSSAVTLGCAALGGHREVAVSFTAAKNGELVLSTQQPSTKIDTVIEVRGGDCEGASIGCNGNAADDAHGSRLTVPVQAGKKYVALVETSDDAAGVFALGIHEPGVCEGKGTAKDISTELLQGKRFAADTSASTSSQQGSCSPASAQPEVELSFTAPRSGTMVASTIHPDTTFDTVLYVREGAMDGASYCDSPDAEIRCASSGADGTTLSFDATGGRQYHLFVDGAAGPGKASLALGYGANSPAKESLEGCDFNDIQDAFVFQVKSGQNVSLKVDTVDAATAADTRLRVRLPDGTELHESDDDVACTFPPPKYECPQYSFAATISGPYTVEVYVGSSETCASQDLANYELTVTVDGKPSDLILIKDQ
jgi:hypothetical protein